MSICSIDGCDKTVLAHGFCNKHYKRWNKYGDPLVVLQVKADRGAPQAFIEMALNHQDNKECLFWPFTKDNHGYATYDAGIMESRLVHRRICEAVNGPPPTYKHEACHNCGQGHHGCVNPHHLRWDTRSANIRDRMIHANKLNWEKVQEIRKIQGTLPIRKVAAIYGVGQTTIFNIWNGKTWKETQS